jgi:hypothetical protein
MERLLKICEDRGVQKLSSGYFMNKEMARKKSFADLIRLAQE